MKLHPIKVISLFLCLSLASVYAANSDYWTEFERENRKTGLSLIKHIQNLAVISDSESAYVRNRRKEALTYFFATGGKHGFRKEPPTASEYEILVKALAVTTILHDPLDGNPYVLDFVKTRRKYGLTTEDTMVQNHLIQTQAIVSYTMLMYGSTLKHDQERLVYSVINNYMPPLLNLSHKRDHSYLLQKLLNGMNKNVMRIISSATLPSHVDGIDETDVTEGKKLLNHSLSAWKWPYTCHSMPINAKEDFLFGDFFQNPSASYLSDTQKYQRSLEKAQEFSDIQKRMRLLASGFRKGHVPLEYFVEARLSMFLEVGKSNHKGAYKSGFHKCDFPILGLPALICGSFPEDLKIKMDRFLFELEKSLNFQVNNHFKDCDWINLYHPYSDELRMLDLAKQIIRECDKEAIEIQLKLIKEANLLALGQMEMKGQKEAQQEMKKNNPGVSRAIQQVGDPNFWRIPGPTYHQQRISEIGPDGEMHHYTRAIPLYPGDPTPADIPMPRMPREAPGQY